MTLSAHIARLAVEALRNGVPNREAVRELGCNQPRAEARFVEIPLVVRESVAGGAIPGSTDREHAGKRMARTSPMTERGGRRQ